MPHQFLSPLTWLGGKSKFWNIIKEQLPDNFWYGNYTFIDAFAGGGSVAMNVWKGVKERTTRDNITNNRLPSIIINDLNRSLYNFWEGVHHTKLDDIYQRIEDRPLTFEEAKSRFETMKENDFLKFFYQNNLTYNGSKNGTMTRERFKQNFNQSKWNKLIGFKKFIDSVDFFNYDYVKLVELFSRANENKLWFFDPPYFYNQHKNIYEKTKVDFQQLRKVCDFINHIGEQFLITIDNSPEIVELFKGYVMVDWETAYTSTSKNGKKCAIGKELIVRNYSVNNMNNLHIRDVEEAWEQAQRRWEELRLLPLDGTIF